MSIRVAIVEDDRAVRENLGLLINAAPGFSCVAMRASAEEAWQRLPVEMPDVVLMDIHLPGRSGIACVARLRTQLPKTQVIMLTIEEDSEQVFESMEAGATGYLVKHVTPIEILEAVADVHNGGAPMSSHIARKIVTAFRQPPAGRVGVQVLLPPPTRAEWGEDRGEGLFNQNEPPLPGPLLHPMEEREFLRLRLGRAASIASLRLKYGQKNLRRSTKRARIAVHAFSQTSLGK